MKNVMLRARSPRTLLMGLILIGSSASQAQVDIHNDVIPAATLPELPPQEAIFEPTISNPELFYREIWERTALEVADLDADRWFTVIIKTFDGPNADFKVHEWLSTNAVEKIAAGVYLFPASDGTVRLGGGLFRKIGGAIRLAQSRQLKRLSGVASPLIQQLGPLIDDYVQPPDSDLAAASADSGPSLEDELEEDSPVEPIAAQSAPETRPAETIAEDSSPNPSDDNTDSTPIENANEPSLVGQLFGFMGLGQSAEPASPTETADSDSPEQPAPQSTIAESPVIQSPTSEPKTEPVTPPAVIAEPTPTSAIDEPAVLANDGSDGDSDLFVSHNTSARSLDDLVSQAPAPTEVAPPPPVVEAKPKAQAKKPAPKVTTNTKQRTWPPKPGYDALLDRYQATQERLKSRSAGGSIAVQLDYLLSRRADRAINTLLSRRELKPYLDQLLVFRTRKNGREALVLAFGSFASRTAAQAAIEAAPKSLHRKAYQFRTIDSIRDDAIID